MPQTRHTPGPWEYIEDDDNEKDSIKASRCGGTILANGWHVARIWKDSTQLQKEYKANAALIAAAPLMLQALQGLLEAVENETPDNLIVQTGSHDAAIIARQAIRKATGREGG